MQKPTGTNTKQRKLKTQLKIVTEK